jgi:predicted nucleic acid-binding protein
VDAYFDSGALVKLYVKEQHSNQVIELIRTKHQIPLTWLHELEIRNALRAQLGRGIIDEEECRKGLHAFTADIDASRLYRVNLDWSAVFTRAESLSSQWTRTILCRSLDITHVAAAIECSCVHFITGDTRQARLASASGLHITSIGTGDSPAK